MSSQNTATVPHARDHSAQVGTTAFAALTPFRPLLRWAEAVWLRGAALIPLPEREMRGREFLHHAYWLRLPASLAGQRPGGRGALLFLSSFTGNLSDYLRGFTATLPIQMNTVWGCCVNWPWAHNESRCVEFIRRYSQAVQCFYIAYGRAGVHDVRFALNLRDRLDRFAADTANATDEQFLRAFRALSQSIWGEQNPNQESN